MVGGTDVYFVVGGGTQSVMFNFLQVNAYLLHPTYARAPRAHGKWTIYLSLPPFLPPTTEYFVLIPLPLPSYLLLTSPPSFYDRSWIAWSSANTHRIIIVPTMDEEKKDPSGASSPGYNDSSDYDVDHSNDDTLNSSGHAQELARHFSVTSLAGLGITAGNVWPAAGGSILVALYNGGPPGVLYEFALVSCFYFLIAAGLAELASAVPSSSGVYQWASITPGPRWGRMVGFYAGYWNYLAWTFGAASMSFICSNTLVQM